jgi:zinc/manganese transport system substrate-binding protein
MTPQEFSRAIENGTDAAPSVVQSTIEVIRSGSAKFLAYNEQATGVQTQLVLSAARGAGLPVVPMTETLPQGEGYVTWMTGNLSRISQALAS